MKRRTVYKVAALCLSLSLFGAYVVARAVGWVGGGSIEQPSPASTSTPEPEQGAQEFFGGSKSAVIFEPAAPEPKPKPVLPGSKVLILDPLPKEITQPKPTKDAPAEPMGPSQPSVPKP